MNRKCKCKCKCCLQNENKPENTVSIDYEKLAEAIVRANKIVEKEQIRTQSEEKPRTSFWKNVWLILRRKNNSDGHLTSGVFASIAGATFEALSWLGLLLFGVFIYAIVMTAINSSWTTPINYIANIIWIVIFAIADIAIALFSLLLRGAVIEIVREKDKNFVIAVFSGLIGTAALVLSAILLYLEVT